MAGHMDTQERFTAPDRSTTSTQVYMYLTTLAHPHMGPTSYLTGASTGSGLSSN